MGARGQGRLTESSGSLNDVCVCLIKLAVFCQFSSAMYRIISHRIWCQLCSSVPSGPTLLCATWDQTFSQSCVLCAMSFSVRVWIWPSDWQQSACSCARVKAVLNKLEPLHGKLREYCTTTLDYRVLNTLCLKNAPTLKRVFRVFWIFPPNVIKIDPYNFELHRFKVGAFLGHSVGTKNATPIISLGHSAGQASIIKTSHRK